MLVTDVTGIQNSRGGVERVHRRVDTQLRNRTRQHRGGVEVGEGRRRGRVGEVVSGDVDRLQRRDRVAAGRGNALLQLPHLVGQSRLVAHRRGHATEQGRHLRTGLREPEDVVDEQQHVLLLHIAEILRHGQRSQRDTKAGARGLVHLTEDQSGFLDNPGFGHFQEEVVALTGALTHTGEHRHAAEVLRDAVDHLLDKHGLADAGTAEQTDLATLDVRSEQVDDLDAGGEDLGLRLQLIEGGCLAVDAPALADVETGRIHIERHAKGVPDVALGDVTNGDSDGIAGVLHGGTPDQTVGRLHRDGSHHVVTDVLRDLECQGLSPATLVTAVKGHIDGECVVQLGHRLDGELHVDDRACYAGNAPDAGGGLSRCGHLVPLPSLSYLLVLRREGVGAADDLADFLGDLRLTGLVGLTGQGAD